MALRVAGRHPGHRAVAAGHFRVRLVRPQRRRTTTCCTDRWAPALALLVWMYLLAAIALIGCEFNAVYERSRG